MIHRIIAMVCATWLMLGGTAAVAAGLSTSASKVDVAAEYATDGDDARQVRVQLAIADGWHVNANPASLDFLVPTSITVDADGPQAPLDIAWPAGHDSGIVLGGTSVKVYSGDTVIPVRLGHAASGPVTLQVRVQACSSDGICLPPSTLAVTPSAS